jgi:Carboxypeptidase regulatory-like domain
MVRSFAVLWILLTLTCIAGAQTNTATLSGTVMDTQGAVVPNVAITVSSKTTGLKRQTTTNSEGLYTLPLLPPGIYSLQALREGFSLVEIQDIELPVAGQVSQDCFAGQRRYRKR